MPSDSIPVAGPEFDAPGFSVEKILDSMLTTGFQATNFGKAIDEVKRMLSYRNPTSKHARDGRCKIFLGYTSNLISSGLRSVFRFLVKHNMVDCIVSTAGGIEEDFIKCLGKTYLGSFHLDGRALRSKGINRIGNLVIPNDNYCAFEEWILPVLDDMLREQRARGTRWTPSKMIWRLGEAIDDEDSVYYWAAKNRIPVFCPAITDGSIGDMLYFHSYKNPGLVVDLVADIRAMNNQAVRADKTGIIILGGGVVKHHICNANLFGDGGANFSVYINTAHEFDGSDAGASPDEAKSWGKIHVDATPVKVCVDATLVFPLLVERTFYQAYRAEPAFWDARAPPADPHGDYFELVRDADAAHAANAE